MNIYLKVEIKANVLGDSVMRRVQPLRERVNRAMAAQFRQCVYDNFGSSGSFRPHAWAKLSPRYAKKVKRDYATLVVTGRLRNAIRMEANAQRGRVSVSNSDVPYALAHQWGYTKRNLPDRPYFPVYPDGRVHARVRELVVASARLALLSALRGASAKATVAA